MPPRGCLSSQGPRRGSGTQGGLPQASPPYDMLPPFAVFVCEERDYKGLHAFPSNITRDDPPITRDCPPSLLMLQGRSLAAQQRRVGRDEREDGGQKLVRVALADPELDEELPPQELEC